MRELATPVPAGRHRSRRRAPKFLVGVRRVAFVLTAIVWIVALLRVSSELATPADGFASALVDTAALWALYLIAAWTIVTGIFEIAAAIRLRKHLLMSGCSSWAGWLEFSSASCYRSCPARKSA